VQCVSKLCIVFGATEIHARPEYDGQRREKHRRLENDGLENDGCFVNRLSAIFQSIVFRILKLCPPFPVIQILDSQFYASVIFMFGIFIAA